MDEMNVLVLGGRTGNIGDAIVKRLDRLMEYGPKIRVVNTDCYVGEGGLMPTGTAGWYSPPPVEFMEGFDAMVCTLGMTHMEPFWEIPEQKIWDVVEACLMLPLIAARRFVEATMASALEIKHMIFIGSYAHDHPLTNGAVYCAAKAGLAQAVKELGWSLTDQGYRTTIVHPYHVPGTPMGSRVVKGLIDTKGMTQEEAEAYQRKDLKMPDHLQREEIADVVYELLTNPAFEWLSGQGVNLYGGAR